MANPDASAANPSPIQVGAKFASGIIPSVINNLFANHQQNVQNEFNRQQIREQNEYNSPSATMNRMIAAGISPKAAQNSIAQVPTLGAQSSVATAAPYMGNPPGTDFMSGLSQGYANDLVEQQAVQQRIDNSAEETIKNLQIRELMETIHGIGLANDAKSFDLKVQPFVRNLELANLDLHHLLGLYELTQYMLALNENPYVTFFDYYHHSPDGGYSHSMYPSAVVPYNDPDSEDYRKDLDSRLKLMVRNRSKVLETYKNDIDAQLSASGIEKGRLNYISSGIQKEAENHLKRLDNESLRLLAEGKIEQLREHIASISLSKKDWLFKMVDVLSAFGPLMSTLMQGSAMYNNVATGISRNRISHSTNWQFNPGTTSFSW